MGVGLWWMIFGMASSLLSLPVTEIKTDKVLSIVVRLESYPCVPYYIASISKALFKCTVVENETKSRFDDAKANLFPSLP